MDRIRHINAIPSDPGIFVEPEGDPGYFTPGDYHIGGDVPATVVTANWLNDVQESIITVIEGEGLTPTQGDHDQLYTAITSLAADVWTESGGDIYFNTGKVGVGTDSPDTILHVEDSSNAEIRLRDSDNAAGSYTSIVDNSDGIASFEKRNASGSIQIEVNPIPSDGSSFANIKFFRDTNTTGAKIAAFKLGDGTDTTDAQIGVDGEDTFFNTVNGGNVGIGTSSPGSPLHVESSSVNHVGRFVSGDSVGHITLTDNNSVDTFQGIMTDGEEVILRGGSVSLAVNNDNTKALHVEATGQVGIGTLTPDHTLHVTQTSGNAEVAVEATGTDQANLRLIGTETNIIMGTSSGTINYDENIQEMSFETNSSASTTMILDNFGRLGLQNQSPIVSLDIGATDAVRVPVGTTGERPSGEKGMIRYNEENDQFEGYFHGLGWDTVGGAQSFPSLANETTSDGPFVTTLDFTKSESDRGTLFSFDVGDWDEVIFYWYLKGQSDVDSLYFFEHYASVAIYNAEDNTISVEKDYTLYYNFVGGGGTSGIEFDGELSGTTFTVQYYFPGDSDLIADADFKYSRRLSKIWIT